MKKIVRKYDMNLYSLRRENFISYTDCNALPFNIEIKMLDYDLLEKHKENCFGNYELWLKTLNLRGGVLALIDNTIIAYGQIKVKKCSDAFYKIGAHTAYLSAFYTNDDYRGHCIYPALLSYLVETNQQYNEFFISAYTTNYASINGLTKVGFVFIKRLRFWRFAKSTVNKYRLFSERN